MSPRGEQASATRSPEAIVRMLTPRERQVLEHALHGETNKEIASALECSPRTVDFHIAKILRKTGLASKLMLLANFVHTETATSDRFDSR